MNVEILKHTDPTKKKRTKVVLARIERMTISVWFCTKTTQKSML